MTDIALRWDTELMAADLTLTGPALATDDGLVTALLISLFSDARARDGDPLPEPGSDRRGWWGDVLASDARETGSRLWLLAREKALDSVLQRARDYAREALAWLVEDGIAARVDVRAERQRHGATEMLALAVELTRPDGPAREQYDFAWDATGRLLTGKAAS